MAPAASMQQDSPEIELHARSRRRGPLWRLRRPSSARGIHVVAPFGRVRRASPNRPTVRSSSFLWLILIIMVS